MIKRLRLKGFRRYVDETFELGPGVTFIDGRNNAGKTTLFLAIEYALTGTVAGARSQAVLLNPDAKGLGVELVFTGRDGKTYKLQRVHQLPPRSRSRLIGHFTLKEVVGTDDERYVLSSDFQDHEDALAKKLAEITGITRRVLDLAVHVRQGEIAQILEGDPRLDIVLGITAAGTANEEMRSLALEDEQAADALPTLEASLQHFERERATAAGDESGLRARLAQLVADRDKLATTTDDSDDEPLDDALAQWRDASAELSRAQARVQDETQLARERAEVTAKLATFSDDEIERRYDLRARIKRRERALNAPTCETCGGPIDAERGRSELAAWQRELAESDARAAEISALQEKSQELARRAAANAQARRDVEVAERAARTAEAETRRIAHDDARSLEAIAAAHEKAKLDRAAQRARAEAKLEAIAQSIDELEQRLADQSQRGGELDREHARVSEQVDRLRQRKRRAEDLRVLAGAFKQLQEQLRARAATELAEATFAIHKALSVEHELSAVTVDPMRYQVLVTPTVTGQAMPASLAQGGGHRLLLGLAFRLALVQRLGPFPFVLLDEPTYGLDEQHRLALLDRIASLKLCDQILLITHQAMGKAPGQRIVVSKQAAA